MKIIILAIFVIATLCFDIPPLSQQINTIQVVSPQTTPKQFNKIENETVIEVETQNDAPNDPVPNEFWVFLGIFVGILLLVIKKSNKDAQKRTVIARRQDFDIMTQINFHETEIKRLEALLNNINRQQQFNVSHQNATQNYPAQYMNSFEIQHPRYM